MSILFYSIERQASSQRQETKAVVFKFKISKKSHIPVYHKKAEIKLPAGNIVLLQMVISLHNIKLNTMVFLWYIVIGIVAGFLAGKIMRGGGFGIIVNLILGIIGGLLGGWVFGLFGIAAYGIIGNLITATIGAILVLWIVSLFNTPKRVD